MLTTTASGLGALALASILNDHGLLAAEAKRANSTGTENPLAQRILRGDFGPGEVVRVVAEGDALGFVKGVKEEAA